MSETDYLQSEYPVAMSSIALRLAACQSAMKSLADSPTNPENWLQIDIVTLQIRKICELVLLGSALAHLREGVSELDPRKWRPKDAFAELSKLSGHPLPMPLQPSVHEHESGAKQILPASKPIPFEVLSSIYGHCGDLLHVPSAAKVLNEKITPFDWQRFQAWVTGFAKLMGGHVLLLPSLNRIVMCTWSGAVIDEPNIYLLEGEGPATLSADELPDFSLLMP